MNPTRLFVLGALARHGPMYGHQIRRDARIDCTELWSEVKPGSLYAALHRLQAEGLIEPVRTEQQGNLPARTVYASMRTRCAGSSPAAARRCPAGRPSSSASAASRTGHPPMA